MTKRIKTTGPKPRQIRSTSKSVEQISPDEFARALGAERVSGSRTTAAQKQHPGSSLPALAELKRNLEAALRSRGGRPGLEGTDRRPKVPMSDEDWRALEELAASMTRDDFAPTPGQVASGLLHDALARLRAPGYRADVAASGNTSQASRASEAMVPYRGSEAANVTRSSVPPSARAARRCHLVLAQESSEDRAA